MTDYESQLQFGVSKKLVQTLTTASRLSLSASFTLEIITDLFDLSGTGTFTDQDRTKSSRTLPWST